METKSNFKLPASNFDDLFFSVIIPVKQINYYLRDENLPALARQTYRDFEAIVLPDNTGENDSKLLRRYPWLKIIATGQMSPSEKRNLGVAESKGNIIAFIDDDAYPALNWLSQAKVVFREKETACLVGPGILPQKAVGAEIIFNEVLTSWLGSGEYTYRFQKENDRLVDDYPLMNFFIKKTIFDEVGGLQKKYWPGEDSKLCQDLVYKNHEKIKYSPRVVVYHHRKPTLKEFLRQHARYGAQRGKFFRQGDRNSRRLTYVLPSVFVLYLIFIIFIMLINIRLLIFAVFPLAIYLLVAIVFFTKVCVRRKNVVAAFFAIASMFLMHLVYGVAFILSFFRRDRPPGLSACGATRRSPPTI